MNSEEKIRCLRKQLGIIEDSKLIEEYKKIIEDKSVNDKVKSKAYFAIGEIIEVLSPELSDDNGYSYFKKAIELDEDNFEASISICRIFNLYPAPFNTLLTEEECLYHLMKIIDCFNKADTKLQENILSAMKSYLSVRSEIIKRYPLQWRK